jgi:hypothetical protein
MNPYFHFKSTTETLEMQIRGLQKLEALAGRDFCVVFKVVHVFGLLFRSEFIDYCL